jgi:hypothetical protein
VNDTIERKINLEVEKELRENFLDMIRKIDSYGAKFCIWCKSTVDFGKESNHANMHVLEQRHAIQKSIFKMMKAEICPYCRKSFDGYKTWYTFDAGENRTISFHDKCFNEFAKTVIEQFENEGKRKTAKCINKTCPACKQNGCVQNLERICKSVKT